MRNGKNDSTLMELKFERSYLQLIHHLHFRNINEEDEVD